MFTDAPDSTIDDAEADTQNPLVFAAALAICWYGAMKTTNYVFARRYPEKAAKIKARIDTANAK